MITLVTLFVAEAAVAAAAGLTPNEVPPAFAAPTAGAANDAPWWHSFDDPRLSAAVETGLARNYDLRVAAARVVAAEAASLRALSPLLPSVTADVSTRAGPLESLGFQFGGAPTGGSGAGGPPSASEPPSVFYNGSALLNARWQLDIWGQSYLALRATKLQEHAQNNDRRSVALALAAQIGTAYYDVVLAKRSLKVVQEQIDANARLLELIELRFERGDASGLDVLQQKQQYAARAAELPALRTQRRAAETRLMILLGASATERPPATTERLPPLPTVPNLGQPADLLYNRPDLQAAQQRWESAAAQASSASRVHLPTLSVDGNVGWQFFTTDETTDQTVWGAGVSLSLPLFSGFGDTAQVREADAGATQAENTLRQAFLEAVQEVEAAFTSDQETREQLHLRREQADAADAALEESEARYIAGLADYLTVLTALNAAQSAQLAVLQNEHSAVIARLQLHQSLGGPWSQQSLSASEGETP